MQKLLFRFVAAMLAIFSAATYAETLAHYVDECKAQLHISSIPVLDCRDGVRFQSNFLVTDDYVISARITDDVEANFICRWVGIDDSADLAVSAEMLVHSKKYGSTCFFSAKTGALVRGVQYESLRVSPRNISPTNAQAADYWKQPDDIQGDHICVNCHVAGAYIASKSITFALGYYGVLNDGHDTKVDRYHAIGDRAVEWNNIIANNIFDTSVPLNQTLACANSCHVIGGSNHTQTIMQTRAVLDLSINDVAREIRLHQLMVPTASMDYRWVNLDTPNATGDYESLSSLKTQYPNLWCSNPTDLEAHVVGSNHIISTRDQSNFPNVLRTFNLKEGLRCVQSDQPAGSQCKDYFVDYECGDGSYDRRNHLLTSSGDNELRANISNLCAGKGAPVSMVAGYDFGARSPGILYAPNDKLAQFNSNGLACKNADQPDGQCSNYVARFTCP